MLRTDHDASSIRQLVPSDAEHQESRPWTRYRCRNRDDAYIPYGWKSHSTPTERVPRSRLPTGEQLEDAILQFNHTSDDTGDWCRTGSDDHEGFGKWDRECYCAACPPLLFADARDMLYSSLEVTQSTAKSSDAGWPAFIPSLYVNILHFEAVSTITPGLC